MLRVLLLSFFLTLVYGATPDGPSRINCFPEQEGCNGNQWRITRDQCESRGCTYDTNPGRDCAPICYMHPERVGYRAVTACENCKGKLLYAELALLSDRTIFDPPIKRVLFTATILNNHHLQFKFEDMDNKRFEVPFVPPEFQPSTTSTAESAEFKVEMTQQPFSLKVTRKSNGAVLFDTSIGGLVLSNRFLQIATRLPSRNFYGLGEHEHPSLKHSLEYKTWAMFDRDQGGLGEGLPLYGTHPVYMVLEDDGNAHGVFIMNSNAQEFSLIPAPAVIYRTIGGIIDVHLYTGSTPERVVQQHTEYVGRPFLPPYWSLGFQLTRYGYNHINNMKEAIARTRQYGIPLDVMYADIDHMDRQMDFTLDRNTFGELPSFLASEKEHNGLRSVIILDPAVTNNATNEPWNLLYGNDTFIKGPDGQIMLGYVWPPGKVAFPDFFLERTHAVWKDLIMRHSKVIPFDGLWIDMNEPANFGTNEEKPFNWPQGLPPWSLKCPGSYLEDPPYRTYAVSRFDGWGRQARLSDKTLCMEAIQGENKQYKHYDVHNLYGWSQTPPTFRALRATYPGRRGFLLARSTFPGSGHYATHWLGDNISSWTHLRRSIIGMLEMSIFGIAHTGPDICGFLGESNAEMCKRWMQLGAFYPYSRNHNGERKEQDPGVFGPEVGFASQFWMRIRYNILPYMYTLFYHAHTTGSTVARPLFFEFPLEQAAREIDSQFMLGSAYLIVPILDPGYNALKGYIPSGKWLNHVNQGKLLDLCNPQSSHFMTFNELHDIALFQRGGSITPQQGINEGNIISTDKTRHEPLSLNVVFDCANKASGTLFWDDGDSLDTIKDGKYWFSSFTASLTDTAAKLSVTVDHKSVDETLGADLYYSSVTLFGLSRAPELYKIVFADGQPSLVGSSSSFNKDGKFEILFLTNQPKLSQSFDVEISFAA